MSILGSWMSKEADKLSVKRINSFEGIPFAVNDYSKVYGHAFELHDFKFLKITVIGPLNVNTHDGCKITLEADGKELPTLESDSTDIKTDFSQSLGIGITEFDMDLADELYNTLLQCQSAAISIAFKGSFVKFLIPDTALLKEALTIHTPQPIEPAETTEATEDKEHLKEDKNTPSE